MSTGTDAVPVRSGRRPLRFLAGALFTAMVSAALGAQPGPDGRATTAVSTFEAAWRIVHDTYFDPSFNGVDWEAVRRELKPRAAAAVDVGALRGVIREMLGRLGQSHFALIPGEAAPAGPGGSSPRGDADVGLDVRLVDGQLLVTDVSEGGPAAVAGVRPGWIIEAIDGEAVGPEVERLMREYESRLAAVEAWRLVVGRLRGPAGRDTRVRFVNGRQAREEHRLVRRREPGEAVTVGSLPTLVVRVTSRRLSSPGGARVGYVRFNAWMTPVDREFARAVDAFRDADGILVDLRGNPGGLAAMLMGISGHFVDERVVLGTMRTRESELRFVANPRRVNAAGERVQPYGGPVVILVDALTGSTSECFTGGMQAIRRASVFGQRTTGQALPALVDRLPNGDVLIHAYGDFVTAAGVRLEGRGVVPDVEVALTRADLLSGRDATLDAALRWVDRTRGTKAPPAGYAGAPLAARARDAAETSRRYCLGASASARLAAPARILPLAPKSAYRGN